MQEEVYANLQQLHGQDGGGFPPPPDTPPPATQGIYLKTLLDVWDKYLDPAQKREFYVNKETQERTYKPPRPADKQKQVKKNLSELEFRINIRTSHFFLAKFFRREW